MLRLLARLLPFASTPARPRVLIYVDPTDADVHDARFACTEAACAQRGIHLVSVWSSGYANMLRNREDVDADEAAEISARLAPDEGEEATWAAAHLPPHCEVVGALSGSDAGAGASERLLDALAPAHRSNGCLAARRDKYGMHDALAAAGLAAAAQGVACEWSDARRFLGTLPTPLRVVLKPRRGSGSLRVGLAESVAQAEAHFASILATPASLDGAAAATDRAHLAVRRAHPDRGPRDAGTRGVPTRGASSARVRTRRGRRRERVLGAPAGVPRGRGVGGGHGVARR